MSIFCVARNYAPHAVEMKSEIPSEPAFFMKPPTALLADPSLPEGHWRFSYPLFSREVHHELELVVRIAREGRNIPQEESCKHYRQVSVGLDFTARDLQGMAKAKGMPWLVSKGFDGSAVVGRFLALDEVGGNVASLGVRLEKNGQVVQQGNTREMIFEVDRLIACLSKYITLKEGDLLFTGTPAGVGPVQPGDRLEGYLQNERLFSVEVV